MAAVEATQDHRRALTLVAQILAVAGAYYLAGRLGLLRQLTVEGAVFTPIWPPTGVALAALLFLGLRVWPGIALGVLLVVASITPLRPTVIGTVVGNTAAPVCAYLMLRRVGFRPAMNRLRDGLALVFLGALGAMLISSTTGAGLLVLTDKIAPGSFWAVWLGWWVGDAMGVLIITPALILVGRLHLPLRLTRWPEALALLLAVCCLVPLAAYSTLSLMFLVYPLLIWAALRFQLVGSVLCALAASVLITVAATDETGAFQGLSHVQVMIKLQAFNGSMALTALLLSAVITEQQNTRRSVQRACQELAEVLEHLTATDAPQERSPTQDEGPARPDR
ncbi:MULTISPECIES: MASE1 domain-containing protein [unclassified Streptomyces]|uniref:MASE1 domain-containing protein n=1 Tax=unclassified Streptomyces TaxID=2593676 RepID=UPI001F04BA7A|nr:MULTISPECIES: MASE1 domain-containing protein [unclassified Streptomyces]MCH0567564.1 MASE1 domain-containing protein [Streptomyces sp. MUM 2J]MCH0573035.1 MASE1 domain-containing protein [Streptomyces sp. MUM 136J]